MSYLLRACAWLVFFVILSVLTTWVFKYLPGLSLAVLLLLTGGAWWKSTQPSPENPLPNVSS